MSENEVPQEDQDPKQEEKPTNQVVRSIEIDERGVVKAKNNMELLRYCGAIMNGAGVPKRFDNPTKVFAALMFVRELGLPDTSIRQVANIHGVMSIFGDLPLALTQRTGKIKGFKEQWFDGNYNIISFENKNLNMEAYGAVCFAGRETDEVQSFAFTMDDARYAGLYPAKSDAAWTKHTKMMLRYRARSIMLKSLFADSINGLSIAEYDFHEIDPEKIKDVGPNSLASEINERYGAGEL